jgi:hypothetical protein
VKALQVRTPAVGAGFKRFGARQPASRVHAIYADIDKRAASRRVLQMPGGEILVCRQHDGERGKDDLQFAQLAGVDQILQRHACRLKVLAVGDHQPDLVLAAGPDHLLAILDGCRHGLFAQHVAPSFGCAYRIAGMASIGGRDEDGIYLGVLETPVVLIVAVECGGAETGGKALGLVQVATHYGDELRVTAVAKGGKDGPLRDPSEPYHSIADPFAIRHSAIPRAGESVMPELRDSIFSAGTIARVLVMVQSRRAILAK